MTAPATDPREALERVKAGRLANGRERCGTTITAGTIDEWRAWAKGRVLSLTPAGRSALAQADRGTGDA